MKLVESPEALGALLSLLHRSTQAKEAERRRMLEEQETVRRPFNETPGRRKSRAA